MYVCVYKFKGIKFNRVCGKDLVCHIFTCTIHINVYVYTYITTYYLVDWNSCVYHFGNRETFNINFYTNANYIYVYHKRNVFNYPLAIQIIKSFDCVGNHIQFFCMKTLLYLIDTDVNPVLWIVNLQLVKLICG